jgi:hypothetical protein
MSPTSFASSGSMPSVPSLGSGLATNRIDAMKAAYKQQYMSNVSSFV